MTEIVCLRLQKATARELRQRASEDGQDMEVALSALVEELVRRANGLTSPAAEAVPFNQG